MSKNKNPITELLNTPGKGKNEPSGIPGILAGLFRNILDDVNMTHMWWHSLMKDFISDYQNGAPETRKEQTSMRGNLMKEFGRDNMTFKVFCKGLRFLQFTKIDFTVRAYHRSGKVTEHTVPVNFGKREDLAALLEEMDLLDDVDVVDTETNNEEGKENEHQ